MSRQQRVPSGKLIDIDDDDDDVGSDFEELNLLLEGDDDRTATNQSSSAKSSPLATPSANKHVSTRTANEQPKQPEQVSFRDRFDDNFHDDNDNDVPTFDVSFSSATFANSNSKTKSPAKATVTGSRWSQSASVGGTVLNNPAFQSDFNADYLLWSKVTAQQKRLHSSSAYSLTSSIVNLISNGSGGSKLDNSAILTGQTKSSKSFSLDSLLTSKGGGGAEQKLLPPSTSSQTTTTQPPKMTSASSNSKYRPTEWSMSSLNSANSNSSAVEKMDRRTFAYGETQRLVDQGSSTRLIVGDNHNDEDDYDSADGFGGFHRRSMINGDEEDVGGKVNGSGGPCSNWSLYKGIFYSSLSSVFFSLSAVIVKYLKNIHPGQLAVCRFVGIFVLTIPLIVYHDLNPFGPPELRHLLVFRGLAGATSLFLRFVAFQNLPIADASVIIFSIPVFVSIFAWIFLKEPCGLFQSFTIIIAMVGLMMTTKLPFLFGGGGDVPPVVPLMVSPSSSSVVHYNSRHLTAAVVANLTSPSNTTAAVNQLLKTAVNASSTTTVATTTLVNGSKIASAGVGMTAAQQKVLKAIVQTPPPPSIVQQSSAAAAAAAAASAAKMSHFYGVLAAMSSLIFASAVFIFIRKAKGAHHAVIMFNFGWVAVIETTVITTLLEGFSLPATPFDWYLIVILGVFSFCGQLLLTRSLQLEQAGPVSVVRATTDIALAFLWQVVVFKETPDLWSIFGALLVSSCILLTSLRKWALSLPERSRLRERLFFLSL